MSKDKHPKENNQEQDSSPAPNESQQDKPKIVQISTEEHDQLLARSQELDQLKEQLLRKAADFDNAKKRLTREKEDFVKFAKTSLIQNILPVLDNMERALAHVNDAGEETTKFKGIVSGIQMVYKQFQEILKGQGVTRIQAVGEAFNPHFHEAIGFVQEEGKHEEIIDEVEAGYMLNDDLIRAAKVRVRMVPDKSNAPADGDRDQNEEKEEEIT